jgi:4'-phosphopantetheinyl transferase
VIRRRIKERDGINCDQVIDGVHIWHAALDEPGWPPATELPPAELERAAGFLSEQAARRWTASRWALRRVLAGYLDEAPAQVELELGENGKPRLRDGGALEFNLSHSEGLALVAVAERPVGVDVEAIQPGRATPALAERVLTADDVAAVQAAAPSERDGVFYRAWTRHEARLKCLEMNLTLDPSDPPPRSGENAGGVRSPVVVQNIVVGKGYAAAVAVAGPGLETLRFFSVPRT